MVSGQLQVPAGLPQWKDPHPLLSVGGRMRPRTGLDTLD